MFQACHVEYGDGWSRINPKYKLIVSPGHELIIRYAEGYDWCWIAERSHGHGSRWLAVMSQPNMPHAKRRYSIGIVLLAP